jgi:hypothetical protein
LLENGKSLDPEEDLNNNVRKVYIGMIIEIYHNANVNQELQR